VHGVHVLLLHRALQLLVRVRGQIPVAQRHQLPVLLVSGADSTGPVCLDTHENGMVPSFQSVVHFLDVVERV
jgi:hypothetical protein